MSTLTLRALLVVGSLGLGLNLPIAEAHQCVEVQVLHSPSRVSAGSRAAMVAGVVNCGSCPTPVELDAWLYDPDSHSRVHLGNEFLRLGMDEARRVKLLLEIPGNVAPGRYQLVLSAVTSGGYMDLARARISVVPRDSRDVHRLLRKLGDDPGDMAMLEELVDAADRYGNELDVRSAVAAAGSITGRIVHKDRQRREIRVVDPLGRTKTVKVRHGTVIVDRHNQPIAFANLHNGDRVEVDYDHNSVATRIQKL